MENKNNIETYQQDFNNFLKQLKDQINEKLNTILQENDKKYKNVIIIALSGKRYSGKDYICQQIKQNLMQDNELQQYIQVERKSISDICKLKYAQKFKISYKDLISNREFKEKHRKNLIQFFQENNSSNKNLFLSNLLSEIQEDVYDCSKNIQVHILTDIRRIDEFQFIENYKLDDCKNKIIKVRIETNNECRYSRGWQFDEKIDTGYTETELDLYNKFDFIIQNNVIV
ncbi:hypothetical protein PPERSA_03541 [Pseudocohnilembus persalinus]|uniref:Phosphomevalonate kinase n=1 Tax=Pseudocohnilembus persalinus TaxID=266149 RepID=A0A0V0Q863_PSEPJ|nr:hypothetical protein PPERSA_03541 [Pseudocohnilembus persalinus]|eukprot:KRW98369.1 hypothetical protein PPERSA_03541 [Pseudocohnilembus persalinus]